MEKGVTDSGKANMVVRWHKWKYAVLKMFPSNNAPLKYIRHLETSCLIKYQISNCSTR